MWDGVSIVGPWHSPIISEGRVASRVIVFNAGPWPVAVHGYGMIKLGEKDEPEINLKLFPGNTVSMSSNLIRVQLSEADLSDRHQVAAIGWRIVG